MRKILKSRKLSGICYDIRGPVLEKAKQLEDAGHKITKLNIGNLGLFGFAAPTGIVHDMQHYMHAASSYSDSKGLVVAREAVRQNMQQQNVAGVQLDDIYLGNGVSELIMMSMNALLDQGDEVLIPTPDYPLWTAAVRLSGGNPVHYMCDEKAEWMPDVADIRAKITPNTRAIVVINPNNPTGALYADALLYELIELARQHQLIVFADEIYNKILFDGAQHTAIASLADDVLFLTFNGLSKNYYACGYRAGWMVISGEKHHAKDFITGLDMLTSMRLCANVPGQYAIQAALGGLLNLDEFIQPKGRLLQQRNLAYEQITAIPGVTCVKPKAALYLFPRLDPLMYPIIDDKDLAYQLVEQEHVLIVQGTGFNWPNPDHFRLVFLPDADELTIAIAKIARFLHNYRQRHHHKTQATLLTEPLINS